MAMLLLDYQSNVPKMPVSLVLSGLGVILSAVFKKLQLDQICNFS
jgi:hypothetical protein